MRQVNPYASPYPTDPTFAIIGEGLGRALFGDPAARQAQQQAEAERQVAIARAQQARSAAGYDDARTRGVGIQNDASSNLVKLLTEGFAAPPPVQDMSTGGSLDDISLSLGKGVALEEQGILPPPPPVPLSNDERIRGLAPALFGYAAQMQGDKVDPNAVVGGLAALFGSDEFARRGMVAQGKTPGEEFALTADRADDIRAQGYGAEYKKATDVATINNASDIPVAQIRADGTVRAAGVRGEVSGNKDYTKATDDARAAAQRLYPSARITQVERDPNSALGKANPGSYHNHTRGAVDVAPIPGMTFEQYVQGFRNDGYPVLEAKNEVGAGRSAHATGDHWHVVLGRREKPEGKGSTGKPRAAAGKRGTAIPMGISKQIDEKVAALIDDVFSTHTEASRKKVASGWRARAGRAYQRFGDVGQAMYEIRQKMIEANKLRGAKPKATSSGWGKAAVVGR